MLRFVALCIFTILGATCSEACWFLSKSTTLKHIESYMQKIGENTDEGVPRNELEIIVRDAPSAVGWLVRKVHGVDGVIRDCDTNQDDVITLNEARQAKHCVDSCWKQVGIRTLLN